VVAGVVVELLAETVVLVVAVTVVDLEPEQALAVKVMLVVLELSSLVHIGLVALVVVLVLLE
jgi:hypothetical protein